MMRFLLLLALAATSGCNYLAWPAYVLAPPPPMKTVAPEFGQLPGKSVAILIYADLDTLMEYPRVQAELTDAVSADLCRNVKGVQVVESRRVLRYQDENPRWDTTPPERLCASFNCDYVLLISIQQFSTREPGSLHLARGSLLADAKLYQSVVPNVQQGGCAWRGEPIRVLYPPDSPLGVLAGDDWPIRIETYKAFADRLARKFYQHKVPVE